MPMPPPGPHSPGPPAGRARREGPAPAEGCGHRPSPAGVEESPSRWHCGAVCAEGQAAVAGAGRPPDPGLAGLACLLPAGTCCSGQGGGRRSQRRRGPLMSGPGSRGPVAKAPGYFLIPVVRQARVGGTFSFPVSLPHPRPPTHCRFPQGFPPGWAREKGSGAAGQAANQRGDRLAQELGAVPAARGLQSWVVVGEGVVG